MMKLITFLIFVVTNCFAYSQSDSCEYVHEQNQIGGFDCAVMSTAGFENASYQWLDCTDGFSIIDGQTSDIFSGDTNHLVALEVHYNGCVDTSECYEVCYWGINEIQLTPEALIRIVDFSGKDSKEIPNTVLFYIYSNGIVEKRIRIEH